MPGEVGGGRLDPGEQAEIAAQLLEFAEQTIDFVGVTDAWGGIVYLNPAARKRLTVGDDATDLTTGDVFPPEAFTIYYDVIRPELLRTGAWRGAIPVRSPDGGSVPMDVSISTRVGPGGEINESVMFAREIARVDAAVRDDDQRVDEVTALLRRSAFDERSRQVLAAAARDGESCALILVTVDTTDAGGSALDALIASTVLRALAGRLTRAARATDVAGRVGESRLGLLLRGVRTRNEAMRVARTVYESLVDGPVATAGEEIAPAVGCGVAFAEPGRDLSDLYEEATTARWEEPVGSSAVDHMAPAVDGRSVGSPSLDEFRIGMSHGDVRAYAEPIVDLRSGRVAGYRGFVRWHHRSLGTLEAPEFVGMVSETPHANQIDLYVAREMAAVLALTTRDAPLRMYVPASRRFLTDVRTEQYLREIVDAFSLSMSQVHLEVPQPIVANCSPALRDALQSLREVALTLVVTNVDAASDVASFVDLGFGEVHVSKRLANAAASDAGARITVADIVGIAHDRGIVVGGTGVDDQRDHEALRELGCDLAAGGFYGGAEPANTID